MKTIFILSMILFIMACGSTEKSIDFFSQGKSFYEEEKDSLAIISLTKAIELDPNNKDAYYLRAYSNHRYGNYYAAIFDYSKTIEIDPQNDEAYYFRGVVKGTLNDLSGAISDYSKAIELNPNNSEAFHNRGMMKVKLGVADSACLDFKAAKDLNNSFADSALYIYCK